MCLHDGGGAEQIEGAVLCAGGGGEDGGEGIAPEADDIAGLPDEEIRFARDSALEGAGFEPVWGFFCQVVILVFCRFFVRSGKAVLRPVACDQIPAARGRGQGTETLAQLGGLPPSVACVSQRLDA